jgi:hypothetical protein
MWGSREADSRSLQRSPRKQPFGTIETLGRVDEYDQAEASGEADDRPEVSCGLFASQGDAFKALEPPEALFDARMRLIEGGGEEGGFVLFVGLVRDHRSNAALPRGLTVGLAGIAFVANGGAGLNVGSDAEQSFEMMRVGRLAPRQVEGDDVAGRIRFCVDFRCEPAARAPKRLSFLPPFAPATDTWARTMVESNIWIRCAEELIEASASKKASKTPALLSRSKRFHTLFQ